jgi:hypothetical protein
MVRRPKRVVGREHLGTPTPSLVVGSIGVPEDWLDNFQTSGNRAKKKGEVVDRSSNICCAIRTVGS